ncbi:MAG: VOC family protein, partial [Acidobacteriota bacterium]
GFDGVMVGKPDGPYHLEFSHQRGLYVGASPTIENLLVFELPAEAEWTAAINRMEAAGYPPVPSLNPYWDRHGRTFEDPDGYRVVLQNATWST